MNNDEQRLSQLLKGSVPHPPHALSADQVTTRQPDRSAKSWALPALAAAAVVVIGVTAGALAADRTSGSGPSPSSPGGAPVVGAARPAAPNPAGTVSGSAAPQDTSSCQEDVTVPAVTGMTQAAAEQVLAAAGFTVTAAATPSPNMPSGTVIAQSPAAGTLLPPGGAVGLTVAAPHGGSAVGGTGTGTASAPSASSASPASPCRSASAKPPARTTQVVVPAVTAMTVEMAAATLQQAGFTVTIGAEATPPGTSVVPGTVYDQAPAAGTVAPRGAHVTLYAAPQPAA